MPTGLWLINLKEKDQLKDRGVDGSTVFKWILEKQDKRKRSGLFWLWTGTDGGRLLMR
jgi:hypothetical protein